MTTEQMRAKCDPLVGMPFVLLPGTPANHVVVGETWDGTKLRAEQVQMVWNDMLLMDAIAGVGSYASHSLNALEKAALEIAERLYGISAAAAVPKWLMYPKLYGACEWGKG